MKGGLNRGWNFEPEIWPDLTGLLTGRAPWLTGIYQIFLVVGNKSWKPHFASGLVKIQKNLSLVKHTNCVYLKEWGTVGETYINDCRYHGAATNCYVVRIWFDTNRRCVLASIEIVIVRIDQLDNIISILQWLSIWGILSTHFSSEQMINIPRGGGEFLEGVF